MSLRTGTIWAGLGLMLPALSPAADAPRTRTVVVGERYGASGVHRMLFGADYRTLWTTPVTLDVLDLSTFTGGLRPVKRVGGRETKALALKGQDGRDWTFRSVDKDPSEVLPPDLRGTIANRIVQDQIASSHPAGPAMIGPILEATGVLSVECRLVIMPDDPALGDYRSLFANVVGTIEEYPQAVSDTNPGFMGATEIIDHNELYRRQEESPADRVDARAFLAARLVDIFLGDFDRHREQWRWAKIPGKAFWQPIPEDRDQVFCRFEGLVLSQARQSLPRFVDFGPDYPSINGITWNGWEQDRVLLTGLEKPVWDEVARTLRVEITDAVIEEAVRRMPPEYYRIDGARLTAALKGRRDKLPEAADRFYRHLAHRVDVYATNQPERVEIEKFDDGDVEVRISLAAPGGATPEPYYRRRFHPAETQEVRLYLEGGDDTAITHGRAGKIQVRVIGGDGNDVLDDSAGGGARFYDDHGLNRVTPGPGTHLDEKPYVRPVPEPRLPWNPPREWGHRILTTPWLGGGTDLGVFLGYGAAIETYGFRKYPYASRHVVRAGYATTAEAARFEYEGDFRFENSETRAGLTARASGIEILRFYGFGNETAAAGPDDFYKVKQQQLLLAPSFSFLLAPSLRFSVGPVLKYATTNRDEARFVNAVEPRLYGTEDFGQVGGQGVLHLDTRDRKAAASRGAFVEAVGTYYPEVWGLKKAFGEVHGDASAYLTAGGYLQPTLALRAGGKRVFGTYPFHEAAFIGGGTLSGGDATVRGLRAQRYAGDASLYGNAELRFFLTKFFLVLPGEMGLFGLADGGRVYLEDETSDKWHTAYGGGLWFAYLNRSYTVTISVARSEQRTGLYVRAGFVF